jgi:hypothetical protein
VGLRRSLTWDQGKEMHAHKRFTFATNVQVYFCDPRSPWQRGSNENTNGLLRQYFPRGTNFSRISQSYLNSIALRLNQRPRKTLGFETPADKLQEVLHSPVELTAPQLPFPRSLLFAFSRRFEDNAPRGPSLVKGCVARERNPPGRGPTSNGNKSAGSPHRRPQVPAL